MFDSGTLVTHMWGTFDLVVFKVIVGSFSVLHSAAQKLLLTARMVAD